jgi:phage shock protein A
MKTKGENMELTKLQEIVTRKNEDLEREALHEAERIIEQIAQIQSQITRGENEIKKLRERLITLEVSQLDSQTILGQ